MANKYKNVAREGYAYYDKHEYPHVVEDMETAIEYAKKGTAVKAYKGIFYGGYAHDEKGRRIKWDTKEVWED